MVAGGQGGAQYKLTCPGPFGGGTEGGRPTNTAGTTFKAATQTDGFAFGQGQTGRNGTIKTQNGGEGNGGGGGGLYGGFSPEAQGSKTNCPGGGGSGYVNKNFLLIVKQLPVINPSCHLRAYQKRDMQVMVLL